MNDPDRRSTSDGFDHDAMFAEIVAHWNEAAAEPPQLAKPPNDESSSDTVGGDEAGSDLAGGSVSAVAEDIDAAAADANQVGVADAKANQVGVADTKANQAGAADAKANQAGAADTNANAESATDATDAGRLENDPSAFHSMNFDVSPPQPAPTQTPRTAGPTPVIPAPQAWRAHEVDDDEEHFEPLPVAPLPVGDLQFWAIIVGMGGGPLLLLYLTVFNREANSYWMLTAIAMSVAGFGLLIARLPHDHENDGDDNGARL